MSTPSGITGGDNSVADWNAHDEDVIDRMAYAALFEAAGPQGFDQMVDISTGDIF